MKVCDGCRYYNRCGDEERNVPCIGYEEVDIDAPIFGDYDYRYLINIAKANGKYEKGKKRNPNYTYKDAMKETLQDLINMVVDEAWDEFEEIGDDVAQMLERRYEK